MLPKSWAISTNESCDAIMGKPIKRWVWGWNLEILYSVRFSFSFNFLFLKIFLSLFTYFWERERERARVRRGGAEREGGQERIPSRLCAVSVQPDMGLYLMSHEIMTWAETKSWTLIGLSHPDAPSVRFVNGKGSLSIRKRRSWAKYIVLRVLFCLQRELNSSEHLDPSLCLQGEDCR